MSASRLEQSRVLVRPRVDLGSGLSVGPGKIDLLRAVDATHSISAAARALGIPYKRAWLLIDTLNRGFGRPVVETVSGGRGGGGAVLAPLGRELVRRYDSLEKRITSAARAEIAALRELAR